MADVQGRAVQVVEVATPSPSPFARSLLFGYVGMFLYEADAPLAERRAAALSLDSTLLAELLGSEAIRELLDPEVLAEVEASLQRLAPERHARDVEGAADLLRFIGDLTVEEAAARGVRAEWLAELERARRVIRVRMGGEERFLPIEDAGRVRDALGAALPVGVPETFTEPVNDPLGDLLLRYARTHGPFPAAAVAERFGLGVAVVTGVLDRLVGVGRLVRGELRPAGEGVDYCDAEVLRRLRRASLARLRAEVEPVEPRALGRFLPAWQGVQTTPAGDRRGRMRRAPGAEDVLGVVEQLAGAPLPASAVESLILPARLPGYTPALLDELTAAGEVSWTGCGPLAGSDGWLALAPADVADLLLPEPEPDTVATPLHQALLEALDGGGALFFRQLADAAGRALVAAGRGGARRRRGGRGGLGSRLGRAAGERHARPAARPARRRGRARRPCPPRPTHGGARPLRVAAQWQACDAQPGRAAVGRWAVGARARPGARRHAPGARPRRGVPRATRRAHPRRAGHRAGHRRVRGHLPGAAGHGGFRTRPAGLRRGGARRSPVRGAGRDRPAPRPLPPRRRPRRRQRRGSAGRRSGGGVGEGTALSRVVLAAADPAQPYGAALPWPATIGDTKHRPGRKAGALVVLVEGAPALYVERGGRSLLSFTTERTELVAAAHALAGAVHEGWLGTLAVERADGVGSLGSELADVLTEAGFRVTPKGLRLRA